MKKCDCMVGLFSWYGEIDFLRKRNLKEKCKDWNRPREYVEKKCYKTLKEFINNKVRMFGYCPYCGDEIDWGDIFYKLEN